MSCGHDDEAQARELQLAAESQRAYADALLSGEAGEAESVIRVAVDAGLGEGTIDDLVIRPSLQLVGDLWADGHVSVADEHLATSITMRVLALLRDHFRLARRRTSHRVLLAGAQGELHVLGLEMAASLLEHAGYDVRLFGADMPVDELADAVARHGPAVVGLSAATRGTAAMLPPAFQGVRDVDVAAGILVGGRGITDEFVSGWDVAVCAHVADAVEHVDALVRRAAHN